MFLLQTCCLSSYWDHCLGFFCAIVFICGEPQQEETFRQQCLFSFLPFSLFLCGMFEWKKKKKTPGILWVAFAQMLTKSRELFVREVIFSVGLKVTSASHHRKCHTHDVIQCCKAAKVKSKHHYKQPPPNTPSKTRTSLPQLNSSSCLQKVKCYQGVTTDWVLCILVCICWHFGKFARAKQYLISFA